MREERQERSANLKERSTSHSPAIFVPWLSRERRTWRGIEECIRAKDPSPVVSARECSLDKIS